MSEEGEHSVRTEIAVPEEANLDAVEIEIDDDLESTGDESATEEEEFDEIERDGKKYSVPKSLKDEFLMHQDYTKKTQEVAEQRAQFKAQQESFQQQQQFQQAHMNEIVKFNQLGQELGKYQNVDWNALYDADPVEAMKLDRQFNGLKEEYQKTQSTLQQAERYQALNQQQESAKLLEQSRVTLASELKDWSPKVASEVGEYLKSYAHIGVNDTILRDIDSGMYGSLPIVLARKAQLYDQLMKKASTKQPTPLPPPVTKIGSKSTVTKSVDKMTDKEFAAWRHKQIKQRS
jgi:hypothetical protein